MSQNKASDIVYDFIMGKIQEAQWLPDTKIWPENRLADELGVSRVAVRDAIQKLSAMSVLRKVQGSGTYVENVGINTLTDTLAPIAAISDQDLLSIMEFRVFFEYGNISLFMNRCTRDEIELLEENYKAMVANKNSPEVFHKADYEFHNIIAKGTGNLFVTRISELCMNVLLAQHERITRSLGPSIGVEDHGLILKYIKEKDQKLAALHMERHIERIISGMKSTLTTHLQKADKKLNGGR